MKRVLGVYLLLLDVADDFVQQRAVLQHQQMRVKNAAFLRAHAGGDFLLDFQDLMAGLDERFFQPGNFIRQLSFGNLTLGNGRMRAPESRGSSRDKPPPKRGCLEKSFHPCALALACVQALHEKRPA